MRIRFLSLIVCSGFAVLPNTWSQKVTYDVRALTRDKVSALTGSARLGSFGSPSINDKGNIAFASVISGTGIGSTNSYSVIFRKKGKKPAQLALQGGVPKGFFSPTTEYPDPPAPQIPSPPIILNTSDPRTLNDNFLITRTDDSNIRPVYWTAQMFRISKDVALNNQNRIAFAGQLLEQIETATKNDKGVITKRTYVRESHSTIGEILPSGTTFTNTVVTSFLDYSADVLTRTTSINKTGSVPYNGQFRITPEEFLPGFGYNSPSGGLSPVATTASTVIGLPYFTTFESFSDAVIAGNNVCFVVAKISTNGANFDGIWQGSNSNLQPVVTIQTKAPGGGTFNAFDGKVGPSPKGQYASFVANVANGSASRGAYRSTLDGSSVVSIAIVGGNAPGGNKFTDFTLASVNDRGQVAILGTIQSGTNTLSGIWLSDPAGKNLKLIVLEGQKLTVGKTAKTITKIAFSPISGLNKTGQIAFTASFTDRTSAVIVAK